ncbi:helix-turn-helix domain-containing protein [Methylobacterium sp. CM6241]
MLYAPVQGMDPQTPSRPATSSPPMPKKQSIHCDHLLSTSATHISIGPNDWSDGVFIMMPRSTVAADLRIEGTNAILLQIQTGVNHRTFTRSECDDPNERGDASSPRLTCAGETILHDLRQRQTLKACPQTIQLGVDCRILKQVAEDLTIFDIDTLDQLHPVCGNIFVDPILHDIAVSLTATLDRHDQWSKLVRKQLVRAVAAHLLGTYTTLAPGLETVRGGLAPWQLRRMQDHIRADLCRSLHLQEVAEICGLSVSHFARAFRQSTGISPHAWLTRERIIKAKVMMRELNLTLAEIAIACGFADQSHFTRVFTKEQGTSPGRWRRLAVARPRSIGQHQN